MTYSVTATFSQEQTKIEGAFPVDMYVINASPTGVEWLYFVNNNQDVYGYQLNASGDVTATEQLYNRAFIKRGDISTNTSGEIDNISLSVPNVDRTLESYIQNRKNLRGQEVYILTTFAALLPSGSTAYHVGETPDHRSVLKEKFYVDSVYSDENVVEFTCKSRFDLRNMTVPGRTYSRECQWEFRSEECDPDGNIAASWTSCDYTLEACSERNNTERFGGFPAIPSKAFVIV